MQKFRKTKIVASIVAIASLLITTISPIASAAASFSTEGQVKNALYAAAAYECINNTVLQNTAIGNKRDSIIPSADTQKVFIGQWLGDANGQITCKDALTKTLGGGNITTNMLNSGQVLNGVYTQSASGEQQIRCNYGIVNSSGNSTMDGTYSWPQGYIHDANGNLVDKRSHGVIEVVFNESGPIRLVGATNDIDTTHTLESMRNWSIDWSQPSKICRNLVQYTEVYPIGQAENAMGEMISMYAEVLATTDSTPFDEWGIHVDDRYHAWLYYSDKNNQTKKFTHTLTTPSSSSTQLELTSDAKNKLLSNISTLYLNGKTDVGGLLSSSADAKYILYGRYLFNGDGNGSFACGGVSVATDDPDFSNLSATDYWDTSQPYVATVNAYKDSTATSKTTFRTKFGGDGLTSPGAAKSIYFPGVAGDCKALAGEFNNITPTSNTAKAAVKNFMKVGSVEELPDTNTPGSTDPGNNGPGEDGDAGLVDGCFNNSGALGWIICPVLRMAGAATTGIYQSIADNYLTVKSETMTSEALRGVWSDFQGYANILFAILLIIVILSQVTGVGLSNYGIKKVLPRLIITIILVNLSFILCSVAVDLSNILGTSLNDLFMNWKIGGYIAEDLNVGTMIGNTIESLFSVGAGTAITVVGIKVAIATGAWEGIILSLLLTVLVAFISIIFFYVILGVRQAAIVILIAVAPVAIVCYALPNTQKVFDRWLKIFSSLLLVFPICGLLMGGSNFASRLLLAANGEVGFMYFLVAMLLSVIPLFFVPTVLKSSMAAMGNIGTKISNMGSRFGNWSNRTVRNTRAYQDRMQEAQRNSNMKRDKNIMDKYSSSSKRISELEAKEKAGTLTSRERSQLARARYRRARAVSRYEKGVLEDKQSEILASREDLTPGTKRYDSMVASLSEAQLNKDSSEWENLYTHGGVENFSGARDASGNITKVTAGNLNALASEHRALLERVTEHPEDAVAMAKLRAVQNIMGKKGDKFHEKMRENYASIMDASHTSDLDSEGYRQAATHLQDNFASQIKAGDRGFDKMLAEIQGGAIAAASRNSSRFDTLGSMGYTAESLNNLNDGTLDRLSAAVKSGSLSGPALDHIVKIANDAIHNPKIALKGDVEQKLHDILSSAYTRTATVAGSSRMVGSSLIGNASSEAIDSIVKKVQDAGDWSSMSTQQQTEYGNLVRNIQDSLQHDTHSRENVRQLQSALQTAKNKGFLPDASGTSTVSVVEPTTFKIERGAPQAERHADVPADWRVAAHAPGGYMVKDSTGVLRNLNAQELEQLKEIQAFNRQIDMRNSSRGFNASGSGSSS